MTRTDLVPLEDLEPSMCSFVVGDIREARAIYCGHKRAPGACYCDAHLARVSLPPNVIRERAEERAMQRAMESA